MKRQIVERVLILSIFSLVCGCGHKGEVADLIELNYKNMSAGGSVKFVTYDESHTTEWKVRTFRAHGTVKWDNPWYVVVKTLEASHDMPEIRVVEECKELNDGVRFDATFFRGGTDAKGHVTLRLPKGDFLTEKELVAKFPDACILLPTGKRRGRKIDESLFKSKLKDMVRQGEKLAEDMKVYAEKTGQDVAACLGKSFKDLNDEALQSYRRECEILTDKIKHSMDGLTDIKKSLVFFRDFPVVKMRQPSAGQCLATLDDTEGSVRRLAQSMTGRSIEVREEQDSRKRKGVVFLKPMASRHKVPARKAEVGQSGQVTSVVGGKDTMTLRMGVGEIKVFDIGENKSISTPKEEKRTGRRTIQRRRRAQ